MNLWGAPAEAAGARAPCLGSVGQWFDTRKVKRRNKTEPHNVRAMGTRGSLGHSFPGAAELLSGSPHVVWARGKLGLAPGSWPQFAHCTAFSEGGGWRGHGLGSEESGDQWLKASVSPRPKVGTGWGQAPGSPWGWGAAAPDTSLSQ